MASASETTTGIRRSMMPWSVGRKFKIMSANFWTMGMMADPRDVPSAFRLLVMSAMVSPNFTPAFTSSPLMTRPRSFALCVMASISSPVICSMGAMLYATESPKSSAALAALSSSVPSAMICCMA